ncbi:MULTISPECIES: chemotaxis protein CheW [unclassified Massilia]|uniref:chemotaxis protein CheW n=1 Tax=unclassified Massilia TaxID=2609279 RepID=UPI0017833D1A|nr:MULTISPECIES: chemotaxis protein CheW [unclassified Massilia]MBD8530417.1 chemotaxis protein CheW [Massilia sp. CFBP 13647]MBD8674285.1 chemotaxis protein CheW [Massilia sp. CFBP 13721]
MHKDITAFRPASIQFLSFKLGGLEYGLDFSKVQELRILKSLERFAADGAIVEGVAVSRGVIMPIVDMRAAFCGHPVATTPTTDVIILKLSTCVMGMVVDGVTDVVSLAPEQISPIPGADGGAIDYLIGLGVTEGRRLILVDIDRLMSIDKKTSARQVA